MTLENDHAREMKTRQRLANAEERLRHYGAILEAVAGILTAILLVASLFSKTDEVDEGVEA